LETCCRKVTQKNYQRADLLGVAKYILSKGGHMGPPLQNKLLEIIRHPEILNTI
jgi:hypothetical protein